MRKKVFKKTFKILVVGTLIVGFSSAGVRGYIYQTSKDNMVAKVESEYPKQEIIDEDIISSILNEDKETEETSSNLEQYTNIQETTKTNKVQTTNEEKKTKLNQM